MITKMLWNTTELRGETSRKSPLIHQGAIKQSNELEAIPQLLTKHATDVMRQEFIS